MLLFKICVSSNRSETKMTTGIILRNILQWSCSVQGGVRAVEVVFVQKFHELSACSDYSIFGQNGVEFLPETPIT